MADAPKVYHIGGFTFDSPIPALLATLVGTNLDNLLWRKSQEPELLPACRYLLERNEPYPLTIAARAIGGRIDTLLSGNRIYYLSAEGADHLVAFVEGLKLMEASRG
jgi:hypothetical protein